MFREALVLPLPLWLSKHPWRAPSFWEAPRHCPTPSLRCQVQGTQPELDWEGSGLVSSFLLPPSFPASLFSPRAVRAGLGRAGGSRSQHSKGGLGGQARGKGRSINPFMSILSVPAESCRCAPSFETHTGHTHSKHAHVSAHALSP